MNINVTFYMVLNSFVGAMPVDMPLFFRKGKMGDWVNWLSEEQSNLIDARVKEVKDKYGLCC